LEVRTMAMRVRDYNGPWKPKVFDCCRGGQGYGGALCKVEAHRRHKEDRRRVRRLAKQALARMTSNPSD
jgi:hypothetical protein